MHVKSKFQTILSVTKIKTVFFLVSLLINRR